MALCPVTDEVDSRTGTAGNQLHFSQRYALSEQILFTEGVEYHTTHRQIADCRQRGGDRFRPSGDNRSSNQRGFFIPLALNQMVQVRILHQCHRMMAHPGFIQRLFADE